MCERVEVVREQLARKIEALDGVVFAADDKNRVMLPQSVVATIIRHAPLADRRKVAATPDRDPYPYGTWVDGIRVGWWNGRCKRCFQRRTEGGHDPCIANLPGVKAACCGHGETLAYCVWKDGTVKHWREVNGRFEELEF